MSIIPLCTIMINWCSLSGSATKMIFLKAAFRRWSFETVENEQHNSASPWIDDSYWFFNDTKSTAANYNISDLVNKEGLPSIPLCFRVTVYDSIKWQLHKFSTGQQRVFSSNRELALNQDLNCSLNEQWTLKSTHRFPPNNPKRYRAFPKDSPQLIRS